MKSVQILLSSYNGEKYIARQIDSILKQKDVEIHLLIRDDGSKDGTPQIIKDYEKDIPLMCKSSWGKTWAGRKAFSSC